MGMIKSNPEPEILPEAAKQAAEKIFFRDTDFHINIIQKLLLPSQHTLTSAVRREHGKGGF